MICVKWDITTECNLRCKYCSVSDLYFAEKKCRLSSEMIDIIFRRIINSKTNYISILGGEPLTLGDKLIDYILLAKEKDISVGIVTNATMMNRNISKQLIESGLSNITISIDSPFPEIHDNIRGAGSLNKSIENINEFVNLNKKIGNTKISINTVLTQLNINSFVEMIPLCLNLEVDEWNALSMNFIGNAKKNLNSLVVKDSECTKIAIKIGEYIKSNSLTSKLKINLNIIYPLVWEYIQKKYNLILPMPEICCDATTTLYFVSPNGDMHICDRVYSSGYIGKKIKKSYIEEVSLIENSVEDIWNSCQYKDFFELINDNKTYNNFDPCFKCKYLKSKICNPCPLPILKNEKNVFIECKKAQIYLNKIDSVIEKQESDNDKNLFVNFTEKILPSNNPEWYKNNKNAYVNYVSGVRSYIDTDFLFIVHPFSNKRIKLEKMNKYLWEFIDTSPLLEDIVNEASNCFIDFLKYKKIKHNNENEAKNFKYKYVIPYLEFLYKNELIYFSS